MDIYGAGKNGTRVEVNGDFSILIPYGCIYTTEIEDDSQIVFRLAKPKKLPASYREGRLTFGDEEDEQKWILEIKRTEISSEKLESQLSELDIQEQISSSLKSMAEKLNNETEGITSIFGGSSAEYIGTHSLIDRQDLKCGYGLLKSMGKLLIMVIIGTPRNIYVSGKMTEDLQVELFLNKMFRSICLIEDVNDDVKSEKTDTLQDDELFVAVRPPEIIGNDAVYCNGTPMDGIRFFLPVTIHQEMINDKTGAVDVSVFQKGDSISIDVIEQPIHCNVQKTEEGVLTIDLFIRSEIGHFSEPDLGMTLYADGRETEIRNKGRIGGDASMTLAVFLKAAAKLRKAITEQGLVEEYRNADPEKEGLLVAKNEDQFSFKLVSGRKRPSMTCTTLLNGIQMGRPYKDESMEAWKRELMPEEGLEELAESGDEAAMNDLANAYLNGDGVEQNFEKSLYWWKKLAECNDPTGQYNVGLYYAKGCGVERDFEKATEWMRKSSENGDKDAEKLIDLFAKAGENLQKAESGDADAQAEVANLMMYLGRSVTVPGIDSEDEFKEAVKWAQKAADNGSGEGCWILGLAYEHGRGVKEDLNLAIEYFEKGVNLGHAKCMGNLGAIYMNGQVKGKTKEDGFRLMKKAAELGDVHSMKNVGSCYQFGNGVDDSMRKAVYWYEKYLEHEEDEELERKVRIFKTLPVLMEKEEEEGEEAEEKTEEKTEGHDNDEVKIDDKAAIEAFAAGNGALAQVKEGKEGNKRFFNVYGDVHDGIDHILNIYIKSESVKPLILAAAKEKLKTPKEDVYEDETKGVQVTIDYIDRPITWILMINEDKYRLEAYQRDEKKGFYDPISENEWQLEDGKLSITSEKLDEDKKVLYLLAFYSLRKYLIAEGVVDQLRKINKYSAAGVVVTATDEDHITYKIVQDGERPDLVCEMFLLGEITCRPYLDELIRGSTDNGESIEDKTGATVDDDTRKEAASRSKKSQLSQVNQLIAESRKEYQKHIDRWDRECNEIIDDISSKSYSYEFEADADIRKIIRGRDGFGRKLEALIKDFDEKAGKIIKDEDDYASLKRIHDYIKEILEDTPNLNISVDAYGARSGKYKEDEFSFSIDSKRIYRKWQDKLHNTSQYKKEQEEKKRAEEERHKAEAKRRKKEMEERRIRLQEERKHREEEQKKAEEERKRAEEEARKKAIAEKYYKAIKDERTGSKESLESAITAYKELGDYEESVAHIESCKQKLDEVIRLEKEEEARRIEEEAQKKARMKKIGIRIGIAAVIIAALLLIAKLTQAYLEEKARKDAYNNAVTLMEDGKYDEAIEGFKALEGYEDSEAMITEAENRKAYAAAEGLLAAGKLEEAKKAFENLGDFSDSKKRVEEIIEQQNANAYAEAEKLLAEGKYDEAIKKFQELGNYSDSAKRVEEAKTAKNESLYKQAAEYAEKEEYSKSLDIFKKLGSYKDSAAKAEEMQELYNEQEYEAAEELMDDGDYEAARSKFERLGDYVDSSDRAQEAKEAAEEQKEQEEIRKSWSEPQFISSKAGGFYVFTFEWSDGATQPEVYFEDGAGKHHLTVTEISKNKIELYDSRGVNHTLTRQSDGGVYWRWESSTLRFE